MMLHYAQRCGKIANVSAGQEDVSRPTASVVRTLSRGLAALEAVGAAEGGLGVTETAAAIGVDKGTASRLLSTLRQLGYARQRADRRFELGSKVGWLARRYGSADAQLVRAAQPELEALRDASQETVHLALVEGATVVYLAQEVPDRSVRVHWAVGTQLPMYRTAMGRAVAGALDGPARERLLVELRREAQRAGDEEWVAELESDVDAAAARGWAAIDRQDEVTRVAAAIHDDSGEPFAAVALSGPTYRMEPQLDEASQLVVAAADAISARIASNRG